MPYVQKSAKPAKPKKPAVLATASPPARAAKEKGRTTISTTTVPKPRAPRASATVHTGPGPSPPSVSRSRSTESASGGESSDVDELSNNRGTLMEDIQEMIQGSITEALAVRDGKKKGGNFATGLPTAPIDGGCPAGGIVPPPSSSLLLLLCPNMFSLAGIGFQKTRSSPSPLRISISRTCPNFTAPTNSRTGISKGR